MAMPEQMPLAEVKNRLSEVVDEVERERARVVITKHGRPVAHHLRQAFGKLGIASRVDLARIALEQATDACLRAK